MKNIFTNAILFCPLIFLSSCSDDILEDLDPADPFQCSFAFEITWLELIADNKGETQMAANASAYLEYAEKQMQSLEKAESARMKRAILAAEIVAENAGMARDEVSQFYQACAKAQAARSLAK